MSVSYYENAALLTAARPRDVCHAAWAYSAEPIAQDMSLAVDLFDASQPLGDIRQFADRYATPEESYEMLGVWSVKDFAALNLAELCIRTNEGLRKADQDAVIGLLLGGAMLAGVANRTALNHIAALYKGNLEEWRLEEARRARAPHWRSVDSAAFSQANMPQPGGIGDTHHALRRSEVQWNGRYRDYSSQNPTAGGCYRPAQGVL